MEAFALSSSERREEEKLPRRDWLLLPALSLVTILLLVCLSELIAYFYYPESKTLCESCIMPITGMKNYGGIPNSDCWEQIKEGDLTEYKLNSSGYRSNVNFGPKSPETYRIVVIGSSFAMGTRVPIDESFASRLSPQLSQLTGKKIEILNMGMAGDNAYPSYVSLRFKDAIDAQPEMILQILTPWDIQQQSFVLTPGDGNKPLTTHSAQDAGFVTKFRNHRWLITFLVQHFLFHIQSLYVKTFLQVGVTYNDNGFLYAELDKRWNNELLKFEINDASIEERVKAAGVPLVTVLIPIRAQAAMLSMDDWPAGYDPYKLDDELRMIITNHGGRYIDILPEFRKIPNPERGYFPVEGHLNGSGHAIISSMIARELTSGVVPALNASTTQLRPQEQEK